MKPLTVTMSAREAVAAGAPFRPRGEPFGDADVALDEVLSLRAAQEPLVLRVAAVGGSADERSRVRGDWFCDSGAEPARLPRPSWRYSSAHGADRSFTSDAWSDGKEWLEAWELCRVAKWMLYEAAAAMPDPRAPVAAGLACLRATVASAPRRLVDASVPAMADAVGAWCRGESDAASLHAADAADHPLNRAFYARRPGLEAHEIVVSTRYLVAAAIGGSMAPRADNFPYMLALSAMEYGPESGMADVVRSSLGTADLLRALARRR